MKTLITLFLLLSLSISYSSLAIEPRKMLVVVNDTQKSELLGVRDVTNFMNRIGSEFHIYSLQDVEGFEAFFSEGLPNDEILARAAVQKKYDEMGEEKLTAMALKAYQAKILTMKYRLQKYPAIIIDDEYVIYGERDLNRALNYYLELEEPK